MRRWSCLANRRYRVCRCCRFFGAPLSDSLIADAVACHYPRSGCCEPYGERRYHLANPMPGIDAAGSLFVFFPALPRHRVRPAQRRLPSQASSSLAGCRRAIGPFPPEQGHRKVVFLFAPKDQNEFLADVCFWHIADNPTAPAFVCYWTKADNWQASSNCHLSGYDPPK